MVVQIISRRRWLIGAAFLAGATISALDNWASGGEISPIVIVGVLLIVSAAAGILSGNRATAAVVVVWAWLPIPHFVKHALGLPDTIHPNTLASIFELGAFTLMVAAIGFAIGLGARRLVGAAELPEWPQAKR
jgi:hypothetical protein